MAATIALLVEDEPLLRMLAAEMLSDAGFEVLEAENAAEALQSLETSAAVILMMTDVQMPGPMNGFELACEVRRRWPSIAILVCSGHLAPQPGELPPGARFLNKPFDDTIMVSTLRELKVIA